MRHGLPIEPALGWTYLSREALARAKAQMDEESMPRMRQRSDRGMSQGGWTAVRLECYLMITVVAVVYVGRAQVLLGVQAV